LSTPVDSLGSLAGRVAAPPGCTPVRQGHEADNGKLTGGGRGRMAPCGIPLTTGRTLQPVAYRPPPQLPPLQPPLPRLSGTVQQDVLLPQRPRRCWWQVYRAASANHCRESSLARAYRQPRQHPPRRRPPAQALQYRKRQPPNRLRIPPGRCPAWGLRPLPPKVPKRPCRMRWDAWLPAHQNRPPPR
jgi:hypothetical protein